MDIDVSLDSVPLDMLTHLVRPLGNVVYISASEVSEFLSVCNKLEGPGVDLSMISIWGGRVEPGALCGSITGVCMYDTSYTCHTLCQVAQ
jgi:hypothetical protein